MWLHVHVKGLKWHDLIYAMSRKLFENDHAMAAGAKAFEWKQEIGINQARRNGEIAVLASNGEV